MGKIVRSILQLIGAATVCGVLLLFGLLAFSGHWMHVDDEPFKADYLLTLAGDSHRFFKTAELYRDGYAPAILVSDAEILPPSRLTQLKWEMGYPRHTHEQFRKLLFQKLGMDYARIEHFGDGHISTKEEAEALRKYLNGKQVRLLLVTSPYHARRAKMIFEETLPNCEIRVATNQEGSFIDTWWKDQRSAQYLVMEFAKTLHYMAGGVFRSTD